LLTLLTPLKQKNLKILKSTFETKKGDPNMWTLFFDGSKSLEGAGVGCILKYPKGRKTLIACRLEFPCTNNTLNMKLYCKD
jgi:hypothetical protein